ncbi:MAG: pyruvate ferredoxin oxidoreductase subunit gamma [Methanobacteriaceae archaeon]|nr:pyruvate ferredoxin oxidoreductase subunit gamma [Methanobacteriaceae archaeon]
MIEIRFHGRGGQGAVTAAEILAKAAFEDGQYTQAFPFFGVERRGAPVMAFTRIDDKPIRRRFQVYSPEYVVVLDDGLANVVNLTSGLKDDGEIFINTTKETFDKPYKFHKIDATKTALDVIGVNVVNTIMLGFLSAKTGIISIDSLLKVIDETFKGKIAEKNIEATKLIYDKVKGN